VTKHNRITMSNHVDDDDDDSMTGILENILADNYNVDDNTDSDSDDDDDDDDDDDHSDAGEEEHEDDHSLDSDSDNDEDNHSEGTGDEDDSDMDTDEDEDDDGEDDEESDDDDSILSTPGQMSPPLFTKTVVWDPQHDNDTLLEQDCAPVPFDYVYSIRLTVHRHELLVQPPRRQPPAAARNNRHNDRILWIQAIVSCKPRADAIVGEENLDRLISSFVPERHNVASLHGNLFLRQGWNQFYRMGTMRTWGGAAFSTSMMNPVRTTMETLYEASNGGGVNRERMEHNNCLSLIQQEENIPQGGFLCIGKVNVDPDHRGKDLGLRMVAEVLDFLNHLPPCFVELLHQQQQGPLPILATPQTVGWTIAALVPDLLYFEEDEYKPINNSYHLCPFRCQATRKIAQYFQRLGFDQAGRNCRDCRTWFLTRDNYLSARQATESNKSNTASRRWWKSEEELAASASIGDNQNTDSSVNVFYVPTSKEDRELKYAIDRWNDFGRECEEAFGEVEVDLHQAEMQLKNSEQQYKKMQGLCSQAQWCLDALGQQSWWMRLVRRAQQKKAESLLNKTKEAIAATHEKMTVVYAMMHSTRKKLTDKKMEMRKQGGTVLRRLLPWASPNAELLNATMALPKAISVLLGSDTTPLEILIELGADPNRVDPNGQNALHAAAECLNHDVIEFLLTSTSADAELRDVQGKTPLDLVLDKRQQKLQLCKAAGRVLQKNDIAAIFESIMAFVVQGPRNTGLEFVGGWLSPRMWKRLCLLAQREYVRLAMSLQELRWQTDRSIVDLANDLSHIHPTTSSHTKARRLVDGTKLLYSAIYQVLLRRQEPTVENITLFISNSYFWDTSWMDLSKRKKKDDIPWMPNHTCTLTGFLTAGGNIEQVIASLLDTAESECNSSKASSRCVSAEAEQIQVDELPGCPLDDMYDIARVMCLTANESGADPQTLT